MGASDRRGPTSVARAVAVFAALGLVALLLVGVVGVVVLRRVGTSQAYREAEKVAVVAQRIVERRLTDGILTGSADSLLPLDRLVFEGVLADPIVHVEIFDRGGVVRYDSQDQARIGTSSSLDKGEAAVLATGELLTEQLDLSLPENETARGFGPQLRVSQLIETEGGTALLFRVSLRFESVAASGRELWTAFLPVLAVALLALALLQIPLAYRLARRVRESQLDRERLLRRAIDASDVERRRIASDLHDGVVQQLAGLSMSLAAEADSLEPAAPEAARTLREGSTATRRSMRSLRSAVMGIYPPNVPRAGLPAALSDLTAPMAADGIVTDVDVPTDLALPPDVESLLFRAATEAVRNVSAHARAGSAHLRVSRRDGVAVLEVEDDGVGFAPERVPEARADGHLGLTLLDDLARDAGGSVEVSSTPGGGTRVRVELPVP